MHRRTAVRANLTRRTAGILIASVVLSAAAAAVDASAASPLFSSAAAVASEIGGSTTRVGLFSVGCTSASNCVGVGADNAGSGGVQEGVYANDTAGNWDAGGTAIAAPSPNQGAEAYPSFTSVSCPRSGNCTTVGRYQASAGYYGMAADETGGSWPTDAATVPPPGDAYSNPSMTLKGVACTAAGTCDAVGTYENGSNQYDGQFLIATQSSGGDWNSTSLPDPPHWPGAGSVDLANNILYGISCSSAGNCAAVGTYLDNSTNQQGLIETQSGGGAWSASEAQPPSTSPSDPELYLRGLSCPSDGYCTAVGYDSSGPVAIDENDGTWETATQLPGNGSLYSVSCLSFGNCVAVGTLSDAAAFAVESGGSWGPLTAVTTPGNGAANPGAVFYGVSCTSDDGCTAVGDYMDKNGDQDPLASSGSLTPTLASPSLALSAPADGTVGTAIGASPISATLSNGTSPTGTITFKVFGPQSTAPSSCSSGGSTVGTASVSGNGTYHPSAGYAPPAVGDYWWYASYGGNSGNGAAASSCGASMAKTVVASVSHQSAPRVKITKATITKAKGKASFSFKASGATGFRCALIKKPKHASNKTPAPAFSACHSPKTYKHLKRGHYSFEVRAVLHSLAGSPATKNFTIS